MAAKSLYALTGGLYLRTPERIQKVKEEFVVGNLHIMGNLYINRKITGAFVVSRLEGRRNLFRRLQLTGCGSG